MNGVMSGRRPLVVNPTNSLHRLPKWRSVGCEMRDANPRGYKRHERPAWTAPLTFDLAEHGVGKRAADECRGKRAGYSISSTNEARPASKCRILNARQGMRSPCDLRGRRRASSLRTTLAERSSRMHGRQTIGLPRREPRRVAAGGPAADEALRQVAAGNIEVTEDAA